MTIPYVFTPIEKKIIDENFDEIDSENWEKHIFTDIKKTIRSYLIVLNKEKCFYCKTRLKQGTSLIPIEHILDKSNNPKFTFEPKNLTISCTACNTNKGKTNTLINPLNTNQVYPSNGESFNLIHAYYDIYNEHINFDLDIFFIGLNEKGKKTIEICKLYRSKLAEEKYLDLYKNELITLCSDLVRGSTDKALKDQIELKVQQLLNDYDAVTQTNNLYQILAEGEIYDAIIRGFYLDEGMRDCLQTVSIEQLTNYKDLICNPLAIQKIKEKIGKISIRLQIQGLVKGVRLGQLQVDEYIRQIKDVLIVLDDVVDSELNVLSTITEDVIKLIGKISRINGQLRKLLISIEEDTILRLNKILDALTKENSVSIEIRKILKLREFVKVESTDIQKNNNLVRLIV